jgi:glutamate 5-kinase
VTTGSVDGSGQAAAGQPSIALARRIVVKVGSSSLTTRGQLDTSRIDALADALAARRAQGSDVVLVSSGAIAAGLRPLGLAARPRDLATQQAAASVGQILLAERYQRAFTLHGLTVGQVLLTADDLHRRENYRNAVRTLDRLLALGVIPIVNENDTVATHEIRFGDNDRLAALVAHLVRADALVLLSDIDGLYDGDPRKPGATFIPEIRGAADLVHVNVGGVGSGIGTGGMVTKIEAANIATGAAIPVMLGAAVSAADVIAGRSGTYFAPIGKRTASRLFWLRHATSPRGRLTLDAGAVRAVVDRRASLLAAGIIAVEGDFSPGDPVELVGPDGAIIARGLVNYDSADVLSALGRSTHDLPEEFRRAVVHRDDTVVLARSAGVS